jgi:hypothetical protein
MKDTDIIGFHRHYPPFRGKRMDWRRFGLFTHGTYRCCQSLGALQQQSGRGIGECAAL